MKIICRLGALFILALAAGWASAQTTIVSSTGVVDSDGTTWANGTWKIDFAPNPNDPVIPHYNQNGTPLSETVLHQNGTLSNTGTFSVSVYDSSTITPVGSGWRLNVCPKATFKCSSYSFSTAGVSNDITSALNSSLIAPRFLAVTGSYGYNSTEAQVQNIPGSTFYDVTAQCQKIYNDITTTWTCTQGTGNVNTGNPYYVGVYTADGQHIQSVAGAVASSALQSLTGSVTQYPEWFGAVGDGVHDDTIAINAAVSACPASPQNCTIQLNAKTYLITSMVDIASTTTSTVTGRSLVGNSQGGTLINCQPTSAINSCIRVLNGRQTTIKDIQITANSNVTYTLSYQLTGSSSENHVLQNAVINAAGAAYGIALGPNTAGDIAHWTGMKVSVYNAATANVLSGNGVQGNVLANDCFSCTIDTSAGDGVLINGGHFNMYGGSFDGNAGIDYHILVPSGDPVIIQGTHAETSKQFLKEAQGGSYYIPGITLSGVHWMSSTSPNTCGPPNTTAGPCAISISTAIPITIIGGSYLSPLDGVQMNFGPASTTHPITVSMINVGIDNSNWKASLLAMQAQAGVKINSQGDIYVTTDSATHPGTGMHITSDTLVAAGNSNFDAAGDIAPVGNIRSGGTISNIAGGFGSFFNDITYSAFDASAVGTIWTLPNPADMTCTANAATDPFGVSDAETCTAAASITTLATQIHSGTFAATTSYAVSLWMRGHAGGESTSIGVGSGFFDQRNDFILPDTAWHRYCATFTTTTGGGQSFQVILHNNSNAVDIWGAQREVAGNCGLYAHTLSAAINSIGFLDKFGNEFSLNTVANTQISIGSFAIPANTCYGSAGSTTPATAPMSGLTTTSVPVASYSVNSSGITGWGTTGGLSLQLWPTANTLNYLVCNSTGGSIAGGAITFNIAASQ